MLRSPTALGLYVLAAIVLALVALAHLAAARRANGHRIVWALVAMAIPVVGPIAYLAVGRAMGAPVDDEDETDAVPDGYTPSRW